MEIVRLRSVQSTNTHCYVSLMYSLLGVENEVEPFIVHVIWFYFRMNTIYRKKQRIYINDIVRIKLEL